MTLTRLRVELFYIMVSMPMFLACVSAELLSDKQGSLSSEIDHSLFQTNTQSGVGPHQNSIDQMAWAEIVGSRGSNNLPSELSMIGAFKIEPVDVGFVGKLGPSVVFAAKRHLIPSYDRLYWVMIRILSEKYGCFIRKKIDRGELVAFKCRDQRIVTFRRRITQRYAVFKARQYSSDGREIIISNTRAKSSPGAKVVAKWP